MTDSLVLYQQIIQRERKARKLAERMLEDKSSALTEKIEAYENQIDEYGALNSILSNVMLASPDSIVTCGPEFLISGMNKTAETWFGKTEQELIGLPVSSLLPVGDILEKWPSPGEVYIERLELKAPSGNKFPVEIRGNIGMRGDERCYVVLFIHDITRRERSQKERELLLSRINESRRLEAIGTLSSGIAHEINTPLQFIGDNVQFVADALRTMYVSYKKCVELKQIAKQNPQLRKLIEEMEDFNNSIGHDNLIHDIRDAMEDTISGIKEVKDIIQVMREFVHSGAGREDGVNINDLISNALKLCRNRFKDEAELLWTPVEDLPEIVCSRGQIQQVFVNIIVNALDALAEFQPENPTIKILTEHDFEHLHITIADNGPGIPPKLLEKVFDPFFTSKKVGKGTGQGLALAKDIVVNHSDGRLEIVEIDGFKTAFKISLPIG